MQSGNKMQIFPQGGFTGTEAIKPTANFTGHALF